MPYLKIGDVGWTIRDTGFGNRIQFWEVAYELNKLNDFKFTILVEKNKWRETEFLNFPHTESSNVRFNKIRDLSEIDARKPWLNELDVTKSWNILEEWPPYEEGESFYGKWLHLITLKDESLEDKIRELVKDRIGIHIRHWPTVDEDNREDLVDRFDYSDKMKLVRKTMDKYPDSKFYISTDVTYDRPAQGPLLPDFRKESHWISEIYRDYDVVDYRDIIKVDDILPNSFISDINSSWSKLMDEEGREIATELNKKSVGEIQDLYDKKILRDIVDIFSLIYCKKFISSKKTGPQSSWSDFIHIYRKKYSSLQRASWLWQE
jgi:hypothetical protein